MKVNLKEIIFIFTLLFFLAGCSKQESQTSVEIPEAPEGVDAVDTSQKDPSGLTKETCTAHWNECSSPCLGTNAEVCIQQCVPRCECYDMYFCPEGYACKVGSFSTKGVCVKIN